MHADQLPDHFYASVVREELWMIDGGGARLLEERRETGFATCRSRNGVTHIDAGDQLSALGSESRALIGVDSAGMLLMLEDTVELDDSALLERFRPFELSAPVRVRVVRRARYVSNGRIDDAQSTAFLVVTALAPGSHLSIISTEDDIDRHLHMLTNDRPHSKPVMARDHQSLPILWSNGSASVLLHEAIGHPAERGLGPAELPGWLRVSDRPASAGLGSMQLDDCGDMTSERLLSSGELPGCFRRESFRAVPLRRMSNLHAETTSEAPPIELPKRCVAVRLIGEGGYDPLTDRIRLSIAVADLVDGEQITPIAPFTIEDSRERILRSIIAAEGPSIAYPGVLCWEDGQRLPVGSAAPLLLSKPFATA